MVLVIKTKRFTKMPRMFILIFRFLMIYQYFLLKEFCKEAKICIEWILSVGGFLIWSSRELETSNQVQQRNHYDSINSIHGCDNYRFPFTLTCTSMSFSHDYESMHLSVAIINIEWSKTDQEIKRMASRRKRAYPKPTS